jgi:transposase
LDHRRHERAQGEGRNLAASKPLDIDKDIYKWRHLIENFFGKLKEFKRVAMRCDKTDSSFEAMIYLATAVIHSR